MTRRESLGLAAGAFAASRARGQAKYRVAIIGSTGRGGFGHNWDIVWNRVPAAEVVAVADPDEKGRARAQQRSGAARTYADYRQMLERERPGIVTIAVRWSEEHLAMFRAAAAIGAHVLIEKPFAPNLPDADAMFALASRQNLKVQVGHAARASESARRIRQLLDAGEIGQIVEMRARGKEDRRAGGEDLIVLGSHCLDLMRMCAGDPHSVFATVRQAGRAVTPRDGREGTERIGTVAGDEIAATFDFDKGVQGYFASRRSDPIPPQNRCGVTVLGSKGAIHINVGNSRSGEARLLRSPLWMAGKDAQWEPVVEEGPEIEGNFDRPGHRMALDLLDAIERDRQPVCSARDGRWTIEMIAGIYQSHFAGAPVAFPLKDRRDPFAV